MVKKHFDAKSFSAICFFAGAFQIENDCFLLVQKKERVQKIANILDYLSAKKSETNKYTTCCD